MKKPDKCLNPNCDGTPNARGLCRNCYVTFRRLVREGEITDAEMVKKGRVLPSHHEHCNGSKSSYFLS